MLVMAIEAIKQLTAAEGHTIAGYELRDVKFHTALIIPPNKAHVEVQFTLHQDHDPSNKQISWHNFRLHTFVDGQWVENCRGSVRVDPGITTSEIHTEKDEKERRHHDYRHCLNLIAQCSNSVNTGSLYEFLNACGYEFGPSFQSLKDARFAGANAAADIRTFVWESKDGANPYQSHVVHPCTLDGLLQLPIVAYTSGGTKSTGTLVPAGIQNLWVSNSGLRWPENEKIAAISEMTSADNRGVEVQISATTDSGLSVRMAGVRLTFVAGSSAVEEVVPETHKLWNLVWKPDLQLLDKRAIQAWCSAGSDLEMEPLEFYASLTWTLLGFLLRLEKDLPALDFASLPAHLGKYIRWANRQVQKYDAKASLRGTDWRNYVLDQERFESLCRTIEQSNAQGKVYMTVGRNLLQMLRSEVDPLELLLQSGLLEDLYQELTDSTKAFAALDRYLTAYSHENPSSRFLEIGAGTGGSTSSVLSALTEHKNPVTAPAMYTDYTFTDISESFFERAKEKFRDYRNIHFLRLDIEQNPTLQGFHEEAYDVVFAANVLHATKNLATTLHNVKKLLRRGGKLILFEITNPKILRNGFIMGFFPGWWRSTEEYRSDGPCLSEEQWDELLQQNGFTGVEAAFRDYESDACHELSILVSTVEHEKAFQPPTNAFIIAEKTYSERSKFAHQLGSFVDRAGTFRCSTLPLNQAVSVKFQPDSVTIFTDEVFEPVLHELDDLKFTQLKSTLASSGTVIWLSRSTGDGSASPAFGLVDGLARVLRTENPSCKFVTIALDMSNDDFATKAEHVARILRKTLIASTNNYEYAFQEMDGVMHICRLRMSQDTMEQVHTRSLPNLSQEMRWGSSPPLRLTIGTPGMLDTLHFVADEGYTEPLESDEVEIEVRAAGLNFKDCLIALGTVGGQYLGNECAGIVTQVGSKSTLQVGDRVCMSTTESFKTYARSKMQCVCKLPPEVSFAEAAALPTQFVTAWTCIHILARLEYGQSILIHAGAGGTGQAAIQLAQHIGAEVFVTVGSKKKKILLMQEYGIPEDHILYSRDTTFARQIKILTSGRGVDVVLNSLAGDSLLASWDCLASYGRFVEIGKKDILANSALPMLKFHENVTFSAFDGSRWMLDRPNEAERGIKTIIDLYSRGIIHTARPLHVYDISDVSKAFRLLADGRSSGKAVIEINENSTIPVRLTYTAKN